MKEMSVSKESVSKEPVEVDVDTFAQLLMDQSGQRLARLLTAQAAALFVVALVVALAMAGRHQDDIAANNWAIALVGVGVATFALALAVQVVGDRCDSTKIVVQLTASRSGSDEGRP